MCQSFLTGCAVFTNWVEATVSVVQVCQHAGAWSFGHKGPLPFLVGSGSSQCWQVCVAVLGHCLEQLLGQGGNVGAQATPETRCWLWVVAQVLACRCGCKQGL